MARQGYEEARLLECGVGARQTAGERTAEATEEGEARQGRPRTSQPGTHDVPRFAG
jgi:hypothetical protein